jgi:thiol-disulfide isomerase/thioredoxin
MLKPIIDESLRRARPGGVVGLSGTAIGAGHAKVPQTTHQQAASVKNPNSMHDFNELLAQARETCAVIFFTSQTCGPCKILYPVFDQLAAEAGAKCRFIKVDIGSLPEIGRLYSVRATPTFITYLKGEQENNWSGADPTALRGNVKLLLEMAWPRHAHESMQLTTLRSSTKPVLYGKVPPIEKLLSKMGPVASSPAVLGVKDFVAARSADGSAEAALPDLDAFSWFLRDAVRQLPPETLFPVVDLLRAAMVDSRFSGYYAEEKDHKTIAPLITYVNELTNCPYALRLVALQMCCNLFSSPLYVKHILGCPSLTAPIVRLLIDSLLDDKHNNVRVVAASLAFNISLEASKIRTDDHREELSEAEQVELAASILEAISVEEESAEALRGFLLALGYLVYCMSHDSELAGLLKSMDAQSTILGKLKKFPKEPLISEVGKDLLAAKL